MFSRVAEPDVQTIVGEDFAVERAGKSKLLAGRGSGLAFSVRKIARELAGKPRLALGATSDHHPISARSRESRVGIVESFDVAVYNDRNRNALLDCAHCCPIGAALVELTAGAAVHGDESHAGSFRPLGQLRRVARKIIPAEPHFQ